MLLAVEYCSLGRMNVNRSVTGDVQSVYKKPLKIQKNIKLYFFTYGYEATMKT